MENKPIQICIVGCGTFGAYLTKRLLEKTGGQVEITVVEIGNHKTKNESQIGLGSISENSTVSTHGRYFGFGGTSARWGGQVLFFDERDNPENDPNWSEIVRINHRHKDKVVENLLGNNTSLDLQENNRSIKTGIWLKYAHRNLFNRLKKRDLAKIKLLPDMRAVGFAFHKNKIEKIVCKNRAGQVSEIGADVFYLTAGALESCRLLMVLNEKTGLLKNTDLGKNFGDHISTELFHVKDAKPVIDGVDLTPRLHKGSLITKRMIVRTEDGTIGFLHGVFNKDVKAFKFLKELLFGKKTTTVTFAEFIGGFVFLFRFVFHLVFKNDVYVDKKQWSLQLDMEQPVPNGNQLRLAPEQDKFGEAVLRIDWSISQKDLAAIDEMRKKTASLLQKNKLESVPVFNPASTANKVEDVYHPVGCIRAGRDERAVVDFNGRVRGTDNLYHFSTGMFASAKSINPSAAVLCMVEEHLAQSTPESAKLK